MSIPILQTKLYQPQPRPNLVPRPRQNQFLIESLSDRELEALGLLAANHANQAIADELVIALSTVK